MFQLGKHIYTFQNPSSEKHLKEACDVLASGGVIVYPTDVNWAFGCDPTSKKALDRIRRLKPHHPKEQPFSLICNSLSMVAKYAYLENHWYRVLKKALPGPYTLLLKGTHNLSRLIKDKRKTVGVRVPACHLLLDLIDLYSNPIISSSLPEGGVNKKPLTFGYELHEVYGHGVDLLLDLGNEVLSNQTTIIDLTEGAGKLIRQGLGDLSKFEGCGIELPK